MKLITEILNGPQSIREVVLVEYFLQTLGHGFQVATRQAAVGREAFGDNENSPCFDRPSQPSFIARKPPVFTMPSFLADSSLHRRHS